MDIYVINGPNLDMLGKRDPDIYGHTSLSELEERLTKKFEDVDFTFFQSNGEGEIVEAIHDIADSSYGGLIGNFAAYTHTSVAIRDALEMVEMPKVEVHISNIHAREEFRQKSITGEVCDGIITGFGMNSYVLAVHAVRDLLK